MPNLNCFYDRCNYNFRVRGTGAALLLIYASTPSLKEVSVYAQRELADGREELCFTGSWKWMVEYDVSDVCPVDLSHLDELCAGEIMQLSDYCEQLSLRAKSQMLPCEILVHSWSSEMGYDRFDHYKDGRCLKRRLLAYPEDAAGETVYDSANPFDWDTLEFIGHEGEFDEQVIGADYPTVDEPDAE